MLSALVHPDGAPDDVALVAVRLLPVPLRVEMTAEPAVLARLRRQASAWALDAGLPAETVQGLQLTLGEAAGNAAEHAYRDARPGLMRVSLDLCMRPRNPRRNRLGASSLP